MDFFVQSMYGQPSLARTDPVRPAPYRRPRKSAAGPTARKQLAAFLKQNVFAPMTSSSSASSGTTLQQPTANEAARPSALEDEEPISVFDKSPLKAPLSSNHPRMSVNGGGGMYGYDDEEDDMEHEKQLEQVISDLNIPRTGSLDGTEGSMEEVAEAPQRPKESTPILPRAPDLEVRPPSLGDLPVIRAQSGAEGSTSTYGSVDSTNR